MLEIKKLYYLLGFIFLSTIIHAQDISKEALQKLGDEELLSLFNEVENDSIISEKVAQVYIDRARKENDTIKMARGYDRLARIFHTQKNLKFVDTLINLTRDLNHITYPAQGYILRGYYYGTIENLKLETENYLKAYNIALANDNIIQKMHILDNLIFLKSVWGNKREALELQKKRHEIIKDKNYIKKVNKTTREGAKAYFDDLHLNYELSSIENFVFCYLNLKKLDSANIFLKKGLQKSNDFKGYGSRGFYYWFLECSIEIDYYTNDYENAITTSDKLLSTLDIKSSKRTIQNIFLFKGLSLIKMGNHKVGISYLKRSDSIFVSENFSIKQPYQRILFEKLLVYYNSKNNIEKKIEYLNKLISADSIIKKNYQYFEPTLIKNFETPILLKEREQLISTLEQRNKIKSTTIWWVLGFFGISVILLVHYYIKQELYVKRFNVLMSQKENEIVIDGKEHPKNEISKNIIDGILEHLNLFEKNKKYLSQIISLQDLAKSFNTNYNYLSKVINLYKGKRYSDYINNLRVEYAFQELKINSKFRKYTIKAIAKESGFKSAESFSKSFYKVYGIYPSFYLKQLESKEEIN